MVALPVISGRMAVLATDLISCAARGDETKPAELWRLGQSLLDLAQEAVALENLSRHVEMLEAVAADIDVVALAKMGQLGAPDQNDLREEQRVLQAILDDEPVARLERRNFRALSKLSAPIGDGKVVSFPKAPRRVIVCRDDGGDAA